MAEKIRDIMHRGVQTVNRNSPIHEAAMKMRDHHIGDVIVMENNQPFGICTDRDIVVNAIADRRGLDTPVGEICSRNLITVKPDDSLDQAIQLMRSHSIRRIPVMENNQCVGFVSLGDLARARDPNSVLAQISQAPSNSGARRPAATT